MRVFDHPWVDSFQAPLYVLRFPDAPTRDDTAAFCAALDRFLEAPAQRFGWLTDLSHIRTTGAVQRMAFLEANKRHESVFAELIVALGVLAPSPFHCSLATLIQWVAPPRYPLRVFGEIEPAYAWVLEELAKAGLERRTG